MHRAGKTPRTIVAESPLAGRAIEPSHDALGSAAIILRGGGVNQAAREAESRAGQTSSLLRHFLRYRPSVAVVTTARRKRDGGSRGLSGQMPVTERRWNRGMSIHYFRRCLWRFTQDPSIDHMLGPRRRRGGA